MFFTVSEKSKNTGRKLFSFVFLIKFLFKIAAFIILYSYTHGLREKGKEEMKNLWRYSVFTTWFFQLQFYYVVKILYFTCCSFYSKSLFIFSSAGFNRTFMCITLFPADQSTQFWPITNRKHSAIPEKNIRKWLTFVINVMTEENGQVKSSLLKWIKVIDRSKAKETKLKIYLNAL